jgi:hypothetical protein
MKKFSLILMLLALVMLATSLQAQEDEELPLGSRGKGILFTDHFPDRSAQSAGAAATMARQGKEKAGAMAFPPYPYGDTFLLHSYPTSNYKLYIDFNGHRGYKAWDPAGDGTAFSEPELLLIQKIWYLTSEDYMPFTIDVTTEEPGSGFLGMRAVVDGSGRYDYGWAYKNVWPDSDNFCYTGIWNNDWIYIAQAASHEVGHTLNLYDHGQTDGTGYYMGHGEGWTAWGVIMGWDSWSLGVWDDGNYPIPNHPEDSLNIIETRQGVDYRPDDHGNDIGTATAITLPGTLSLVAEGIIEQNADVDYFSFTLTASDDVQFSINEDVVMGCTNLDVLAKIHDSGGAVLYTSNPLWDIWASFSVTLAAGDYYLSIDGTGQDHPDGEPWEGYGYSDYGILGYYSIQGMVGTVAPDVTPPTPDPMTFAVAPGATGNTSVAMIATTATDTENGVQYNFVCTAGGGNDSGWQPGTYYEDTGLSAATEYTYTVTARDTSPAQNETAASAPASATTSDGINIVLPANGGLLESFTSEYSSTWGSAAALTNGSTTDVGWCSDINPSSPQEFVYSFDSGQDATLDSAVMHTGDGEGGVYLSQDVEVWTSANGTDFTFAGSATLPQEKYRAVGIDLGGVTAKKVKLSITSGYRTDYWEMGEFVVLGAIGGGDNVIVPDVVGMAQAAAESAIVAADLVVGTVTTESSATVPAGDVISQDPTGGASVPSGSSVDLVVSTGPGGTPPSAPSGLSATAISKTEIDIDWTDNSDNETGFKIERSKRVNTAYSQIDIVGADVTFYHDTGLSKNTTYYYRVRATNGDGDSAYSNEASATTPLKD